MLESASRIQSFIQAISVALVAILLIGAFPASTTADEPAQLYIGHRARLTADIPASWTIPVTGADVSGPDGFAVSYPLPGGRLEEACSQFADETLIRQVTVKDASWHGMDACRIDGTLDAAPVVGLVIPHARPFSIGDQLYAWAVIVTDPQHFAAVSESISFDPELVTPQLFVDSVLELMETRALYGGDVDWHRIRANDEPLVRDVQTLQETHWVIKDALTNLGYWGDNHSLFISDASTLTANEMNGLGMVLDARTVILVYPDGPAAVAGIRVGDTIEAVNGSAFNGIRPIQAGADIPVTLEIRRLGARDPITVTVLSGPYSPYIEPGAERLEGDIGYVELFGNFRATGTEKEYATAANTAIQDVDEPGTCGWIVDLRRDMGGNYIPMVVGIAPILGNGHILSWVFPGGHSSSVDIQEGNVVVDGVESSPPIGARRYSLEDPNPPVAVLIGPYTASSGEATAIAFVGRPDTRLFGQPSGGYTTVNGGNLLFDGSMVLLAEGVMADRNGETYLGGIMPDEVVQTDWTVYGTGNDPVIQAATDWLEQQPACGVATPVATPSN